jgi:hypothetical protein
MQPPADAAPGRRDGLLGEGFAKDRLVAHRHANARLSEAHCLGEIRTGDAERVVKLNLHVIWVSGRPPGPRVSIYAPCSRTP